jgi:hypothetical protein
MRRLMTLCASIGLFGFVAESFGQAEPPREKRPPAREEFHRPFDRPDARAARVAEIQRMLEQLRRELAQLQGGDDRPDRPPAGKRPDGDREGPARIAPPPVRPPLADRAGERGPGQPLGQRPLEARIARPPTPPQPPLAQRFGERREEGPRPPGFEGRLPAGRFEIRLAGPGERGGERLGELHRMLGEMRRMLDRIERDLSELSRSGGFGGPPRGPGAGRPEDFRRDGPPVRPPLR